MSKFEHASFAPNYTPDIYPPDKPIEEMNLDECSRGLCSRANGDIQECLSCSAQCKFGKRIEELLQVSETAKHNLNPEWQKSLEKARAKRSAAVNVNRLQAIASGNPRKWFTEHGKKNVADALYQTRRSFSDMTPEEAKAELEKMGLQVEVEYEGRELIGDSDTHPLRQRARIRDLHALASGNPRKWFTENGTRPSNGIPRMKQRLGNMTPEEAKQELEKMGLQVEVEYETESSPEAHAAKKEVNKPVVKPSLLEEISLQELHHMRDSRKMTNREIADQLGVSYQTILNILGPQPKEFRAPAGAYDKPIRKRTSLPAPTRPQTWNPEDWQFAETIHKLTGTYMQYEVNSTKNTVDVTLCDGHSIGTMTKADLVKCIDEMLRVSDLIV